MQIFNNINYRLLMAADLFRGPLARDAEDVVTKSTLTETGWFDGDALKKAVADHRAGISDNGRLIWQLVMLDKSLSTLFS